MLIGQLLQSMNRDSQTILRFLLLTSRDSLASKQADLTMGLVLNGEFFFFMS